MKGVVPLGDRRLEVRELEQPEPGPGEAVVALRSAGICGSDLHAYHRSWEQIGERQNLVIGHEASGVVAAVGAGVDAALVGTRVSVYHYRGCGLCRHCVAGDLVFCPHKRGYGWHVHGADADFLLTDARNCCPLPAALSHADGSFLACAAGTAYGALRKLESVPGRATFAVVGLGPVGLAAAMLAHALGWQVIGIDLVAARRKFAERFGIRTAGGGGGGGGGGAVMELADELRELGGGSLPLRVFDASGSEGGLAAAVEAVGATGRVVTVGKGMWPLRFASTIDVADLIRKQAQVAGSWILPLPYYYDLVDLLVATGTSFEPLVTASYPIQSAAEAFAVADRPETLGKVCLTWPDASGRD